MPPHGLKKEMKLPDAAERASQSEQPNGHPGTGAGAGARFALLIVVVALGGCCCLLLLLLLLLVVAGMGVTASHEKVCCRGSKKTKKAKYLH